MFWTFYFLAKTCLFFAGYLRFDALWNLVFLALVLLPLPHRLQAVRWFGPLRHGAAVPLAALLLWHDSWLPPIGRAAAFLADPTTLPSLRYIAEFLARYLDPLALAAIAGSFVACAGAWRWQPARRAIAVTAAISIAAAAATNLQEQGAPVAESVKRFHVAEAARTVAFPPLPTARPAFDVILLHVCSLSWDDLEQVGLRNHSFLRRFNLLFTEFNSVTSYSGTAVLRLLRAGCGQSTHGELFGATRPDCYLLDRLRQHGFRSYAAMDHDGIYGNFLENARELGHLDPPASLEGIPVRQYNFDDSPIFDGHEVLDRWWRQRLRERPRRAVLYYNTITLHEGTRWADPGRPDQERRAMYRESAELLFDNLQRFFDGIERSGRNVMVVLVAEHGAALGSSPIQASGLRELPLPQITRVPVAVKFFGGKWNGSSDQYVVAEPTSYQAIAWLIAEAIRKPPFGTRAGRMDLVQLPRTHYLADIEGAQVADVEGEYFVRKDESRWTRLPEIALPRGMRRLAAREAGEATSADPASGL